MTVTRLMTRQEVADWYGVTVRTIDRMVARGTLKPVYADRRPRFPDHEVRDLRRDRPLKQ